MTSIDIGCLIKAVVIEAWKLLYNFPKLTPLCSIGGRGRLFLGLTVALRTGLLLVCTTPPEYDSTSKAF